MYKYFKIIAESNSCALKGACSIHPSTNALSTIIQEEVKEIAFYLVKLKELNFSNDEINSFCINALSIFLINTSFNQKKYLNLIEKLRFTKKEAKEKYIKYCSEKNISCEIIKNEFNTESELTINKLIKQAESLVLNKQKNCDKEKLRLFELISLFSKLSSIVSVKNKNEGAETKDFNYEILRFLALSNSFSIRQEKLKRRILEFCTIFQKEIKKLNIIQEKNYGEKTNAKVNVSNSYGRKILVSGSDLNELKELLLACEEFKNEDISVYTHGAMFIAHFFPYFQNHPFLKGHLGTNDAEYDFSNFSGVILLTQNFVQKIDNLYRGEIFSNKIISFDKVVDIQNNNYVPVVEMASKLEYSKKENSNHFKIIQYDKKIISKALENFKESEIIIVVGNIENNDYFTQYKNKKILNLNCPCDIEILLEALDILKKKDVHITIFFAQCSITNLKIIFSLLNQNIKIYMANCSHVLINPHVIESLKTDFGLKIIYT